MMGQKKNETQNRPFRRLRILIRTVGIACILAAALLVLYNVWDSGRAGRESAAVAKQIQHTVTEEGLQKLDPNKEMPVVTIDGRQYIGTLEIPSISRRLPVMADWSYRNLKLAPCRYSGSYYADNLVICGHNYASHFSPLKWIAVGADVYFTNVEGLRLHYVVSNVETVRPTAVEEMVDNQAEKNSKGNSETGNKWDLTLFTCNTGGQTRCAVRCIRKN